MLQLLRSKNFFPWVRLHFLTERKQMYIFFKIMAHDKYCFFFSAQNLHSWFVERTISEMMNTYIALDWLQIKLNFSWTSCKAVQGVFQIVPWYVYFCNFLRPILSRKPQMVRLSGVGMLFRNFNTKWCCQGKSHYKGNFWTPTS